MFGHGNEKKKKAEVVQEAPPLTPAQAVLEGFNEAAKLRSNLERWSDPILKALQDADKDGTLPFKLNPTREFSSVGNSNTGDIIHSVVIHAGGSDITLYDGSVPSRPTYYGQDWGVPRNTVLVDGVGLGQPAWWDPKEVPKVITDCIKEIAVRQPIKSAAPSLVNIAP
jgi:hypothetical protein